MFLLLLLPLSVCRARSGCYAAPVRANLASGPQVQSQCKLREDRRAERVERMIHCLLFFFPFPQLDLIQFACFCLLARVLVVVMLAPVCCLSGARRGGAAASAAPIFSSRSLSLSAAQSPRARGRRWMRTRLFVTEKRAREAANRTSESKSEARVICQKCFPVLIEIGGVAKGAGPCPLCALPNQTTGLPHWRR